MADDGVNMGDEVQVDVKRAGRAAHRASDQADKAEDVRLHSIDEVDWTAQDADKPYLVISRHEEWPTQDYVNSPPEPVEFHRPVPDSI